MSEKLNLEVLFEYDLNPINEYKLYRDSEGKLYEQFKNDGELNVTTVWKLLKNTFESEQASYYQGMEGWLPFLQDLQKNSPSVVDKLITECKAFDQVQLRNWMEQRSDAELEELENFGRIVANFASNEYDYRHEEEYDVEEEDDVDYEFEEVEDDEDNIIDDSMYDEQFLKEQE